MPMESLLDPERAEEHLRALVALSLAAAMAAARLRSHVRIDRDSLRRVMGKFMVGMRIYR